MPNLRTELVGRLLKLKAELARVQEAAERQEEALKAALEQEEEALDRRSEAVTDFFDERREESERLAEWLICHHRETLDDMASLLAQHSPEFRGLGVAGARDKVKTIIQEALNAEQLAQQAADRAAEAWLQEQTP